MIKRYYLPTRPLKSMNLVLIGLLFCVYALENSPIASVLDSQIFNFLVKPLIWLGIALIVYMLPNIRNQANTRQKQSINLWAFNFAIIFIVVSIAIGIFDGLGKSPYNHTLKGVLMNILLVGSMLVGKEFVRSWLVSNLTKYENYIVFAVVAFIMTFIGFSINSFAELKGYEETVKFIAQYFAPEFSHNLLAVYLAYLGGPLPAIIYMGVLQAFYWLSPVLPNLQWITAAVVGIMCPIFFLTAIQSIFLKEAKLIKKRDKAQESVFSWILTSLFSIGVIWFVVGVFPIYPSVIATGSMEPMIKPGDVILVRKVEDIKEVQIGDVIQFRRDNILISHRVLEIKEDDKKGISYRTKGDNNSGADTELVIPEDIKGKIISVVPKIGWPTLLIKSRQEVPLERVEF